MSHYVPYVGKAEDGREVLVTIQLTAVSFSIESVEVAFRSPQYRTWGPPVTCERAP